MLDLNTALSGGQAAFALMLDKAPYLVPLWDMQKREYLPEKIERFLGSASHGEAIMCRFFLSVWRHDNDFQFDAIEAARVLDEKNMQIITDWLSDPFWP